VRRPTRLGRTAMTLIGMSIASITPASACRPDALHDKTAQGMTIIASALAGIASSARSRCRHATATRRSRSMSRIRRSDQNVVPNAKRKTNCRVGRDVEHAKA
jgi:hypothetical protein